MIKKKKKKKLAVRKTVVIVKVCWQSISCKKANEINKDSLLEATKIISKNLKNINSNLRTALMLCKMKINF